MTDQSTHVIDRSGLLTFPQLVRWGGLSLTTIVLYFAVDSYVPADSKWWPLYDAVFALITTLIIAGFVATVWINAKERRYGGRWR